MRLAEIIFIAIGLSMDAFAVSILLGLSKKNLKPVEYLIPGLYFGLFQVLMPALGFFVGIFFVDKIQFTDHWIAFALLCFIGGRMCIGSFSKKEEKDSGYSFRFFNMLILAIATSIDALAVGIAFSFLRVNIFLAITVIGSTTFLLSTCGVAISKALGRKFQSKAEFAGGIVLIAIGVKILLEHLLA